MMCDYGFTTCFVLDGQRPVLVPIVTCIMSRLNDDLEHLELDYLRHQALSSMTPKVFYHSIGLF